jgi:multiple sugar transport system ATP-binding protein
MADVVFDKVTKRYGDVTVIEGLDLAIQDREFMVLVGPSGCGKSTALRMIAGLEEISSGTISIGGRVVNELPPKDRDIAMVFQSYALYPHMSVRENLGFGLRMRKTPREEIDKLVDDAADVLGIRDLLDRKPKQLSGGQRQRVAVGRAIVRRPAVFLFDEPLSNLDAKLRVQMRAEIARLQQRLETTTVYVTHDQVEAMTMGHRIAVLSAGKLQQVGAPLEVYSRPANLFVAQFIGTLPMNLIQGTLEQGGGTFVAGDLRLPVPAGLRAATAGRGGGRVTAGIRPEAIHEVGATDLSGELAQLTLEVDFAEPLGHEVVVYGHHGAHALVATLGPNRVPPMGSRLEVLVELAALHLFDTASGQRLAAAT